METTDLKGILDSLDPPAQTAQPGQDTGAAPDEFNLPSKPEGGEAPQYFSDTAKTIDEMYRKGATQEEVTNFFRLQAIDLSKMNDEELAREALRMEYGGLAESDIEELFQERYGADTAALRAQMKKTAMDTRSKIQEMQKTAAMPAAGKLLEQQQKAETELRQNWQFVSEGIAERSLSGVDVVIPSDTGAEYKFTFPVKEDVRKAAVESATMFAMQQNIPLTKEGVQKNKEALVDHMRRVAYFLEGPEMVEAAVRDALTKGVRLGRKQEVRPSQGGASPQPGGTEGNWLADLRKRGI